MRRLLKFSNYLTQAMVIIDISRTIKHWVSKKDTTKDEQTKNKH